MIEKVHINDVTTLATFRNLFPRTEAMIETIAAHMKQNGFDPSQPIICWSQPGNEKKPTVVDGHTRLAAARRCNMGEISIHIKSFQSEDEALGYAVHNQRDRRNMTDDVLYRCIEAVDKTKRQGERTDLASCDAKLPGKSSEVTAKILGTSPRMVEKVRTIIKRADAETKEAVLAGKKRINKAYKETTKDHLNNIGQIRSEIPKTTPTLETPFEKLPSLDKIIDFLDRVVKEASNFGFVNRSMGFGAEERVRLDGSNRKYRGEDDPPRELTEDENLIWHTFFKAERASHLLGLIVNHLRPHLPPEVKKEKYGGSIYGDPDPEIPQT